MNTDNSRVNTEYVLNRLKGIYNDSRNRSKGLKEFIEECEYNINVDDNLSTVIIDPCSHDAEILVVSDEYSIGGIKYPQEVVNKIEFFCPHNTNMFEDPTEGELAQFVGDVMSAANKIRDLHVGYPDKNIHIQVRFNFTHVNI